MKTYSDYWRLIEKKGETAVISEAENQIENLTYL